MQGRSWTERTNDIVLQIIKEKRLLIDTLKKTSHSYSKYVVNDRKQLVVDLSLLMIK